MRDMTNDCGVACVCQFPVLIRDLQLCIGQHGSLGSVPFSSEPGQMRWVTTKVLELASHQGKEKCFTKRETKPSLLKVEVEKKLNNKLECWCVLWTRRDL